jgi:hypothetical protein
MRVRHGAGVGIAPIGLFIVAGIFMSVCAAADLVSGSARDYCHQRAAL